MSGPVFLNGVFPENSRLRVHALHSEHVDRKSFSLKHSSGTSSIRDVPGLPDESFRLELSEESRLFSSIGGSQAIFNISFRVNYSTASKADMFYDGIEKEPLIAKLTVIFETLQKITGRDYRGELENSLKGLVRFLKGNNGHIAEAHGSGRIDIDIARSESVRIDVDIQIRAESGHTVVRIQNASADPVILDLDGDGLEISTVAGGIEFDINADGIIDRTAFVTGGDGVLALDRNGDGRITSGAELFGDRNGAANGYAELEKFDDNRDGIIDKRDRIYTDLRVLVSTGGPVPRIMTLEELGIVSISTGRREKADFYINGNYVKEKSTFVRADGSKGTLAEAYFRYDTTIYA